jgi:hypothetical protein
VEVGRELDGVADGVEVGVELVLLTPTRDFLVDERGVMLLQRKALTGVTSSCWAVVAALGVTAALLRAVRLVCELLAEEAPEGARRGATGVFAVRVVASVGFNGRPLFVFERSLCMVRDWRC